MPSSRQARRERRVALRKAKKAEKNRTKAEALEIGFVSQNANAVPTLRQESQPTPKIGFVFSETPEPAPPPPAEPPTAPEIGFVSQNAPQPSARAEINRANSLHSTGPKTPAGKLASSRNSFKHGLASGELTIPDEDPAEFEALLRDLVEEHQPAHATEELLVKEMAQSWWLAQRAIRLQNECFTENGVDERRLSLFLRYQTTHERAFHKALNTLLRLRKERSRSANGFVSQPASKLGFVSQNDPTPLPSSEFVWKNGPLESQKSHAPQSEAA